MRIIMIAIVAVSLGLLAKAIALALLLVVDGLVLTWGSDLSLSTLIGHAFWDVMLNQLEVASQGQAGPVLDHLNTAELSASSVITLFPTHISVTSRYY